MQKILVIIGIILLIIGLLWPLIKKSGLGKLPGDIFIQKGNFTFYFPITTSLVISVVLMILLWFFNR